MKRAHGCWAWGVWSWFVGGEFLWELESVIGEGDSVCVWEFCLRKGDSILVGSTLASPWGLTWDSGRTHQKEGGNVERHGRPGNEDRDTM